VARLTVHLTLDVRVSINVTLIIVNLMRSAAVTSIHWKTKPAEHPQKRQRPPRYHIGRGFQVPADSSGARSERLPPRQGCSGGLVRVPDGLSVSLTGGLVPPFRRVVRRGSTPMDVAGRGCGNTSNSTDGRTVGPAARYWALDAQTNYDIDSNVLHWNPPHHRRQSNKQPVRPALSVRP